MNEVKSSKFVYILHKYAAPAFIIILSTDFLNFKQLSWENILVLLVICSGLILYQFLFARKIVFAYVNRNGIRFGNKMINWSEINSIDRTRQLYYLRTNDNKKYIFPIDQIGFIGMSYSDSAMDQVINLMKNKYGF